MRPSSRASAAGDAVFVFGGDGVVNEALNGLPAGQAARGRSRRRHERALRARSGVPQAILRPRATRASAGSRSAG